jgi:hypothetical protein
MFFFGVGHVFIIIKDPFIRLKAGVYESEISLKGVGMHLTEYYINIVHIPRGLE